MPTVQERVTAGITFLTEKGLIDKLDIDTLNVSSFSNCPVGQAIGDFDRREDIGIEMGESAKYGFDAYEGEDNANGKAFNALTAEWKHQLKELRSV